MFCTLTCNSLVWGWKWVGGWKGVNFEVNFFSTNE